MKDLDDEQYWMITGDWLQIIEPPVIAEPGQAPQEPMIIPMKKTEFINMHPGKYCILVQKERPRYSLIMVEPITRKAYETVNNLSSSIKRVLSEEEAQPESNLIG